MSEPFSARRLLLPLVPLYRSALGLRELRLRTGIEPVRRLRYPVVSVGNLSTGGSGKTPLTISLAKLLSKKGFHVDALSRGYGRKSQLAARVNPDGRAEEFGDEPLLIARETGLPIYVAPQRYDAGVLAEKDATEENRAIVHLLDDGFQHRQLAREIDILLLDRRDWQGGLLPAGNLREPLSAIRRASIIAIPADDPELEDELRSRGWQEPIWRLLRKMEVPAITGSVAAFCGIARPEQFFAGLEAAGLRLTSRTGFRDHHVYTTGDIERLVSLACAAKATALITTDKDLLRLGESAAALRKALPLETARLTIDIEDQDTALDWLSERLG